MEIRKLQSTGGASLIITLPKPWVRRYRLTNKDSVVVSIQPSGALVVQPAKRHAQMAKSTIDLAGLNDGMLTREIIAHYIAGSDEILLTHPKLSVAQRNCIREASTLLIGFETMDKSSQSMMIKNVFDVAKFPTQQNIESMFTTARSMFEDALKALANNDRELAHDIVERDVEMDKLQLAIERQFHIMLDNRISQEELGLDYEDLEYFNGVATQLERIADHAVKLAKLLLATKKGAHPAPTTKQIKTIAPAVLSLLNESQEAVRTMSGPLSHKLLDACTTATQTPQSTPFKSAVDVLTVDSLDRLRGYITNIAELTIDHLAVKKLQQQ